VLPPPHRNGASLDASNLDSTPPLSLDAIASAASPTVALSKLSPDQLAVLAGRCATVQSAIQLAIAHASNHQRTDTRNHDTDADRILDADAIARELGQSRRWLFRNARKIPCIRRISRKALAAPAAQVRRWRDLQRP
jgi:hypothetical protein